MVKISLTNGLLLIIACCLVLHLCVQLGFIPKAHAGSPVKPPAPTEVIIVGVSLDDRSLPHAERIIGGLPVKIISEK